MSIAAAEEEIRTAYLRLQRGAATLRYHYDHYLDSLSTVDPAGDDIPAQWREATDALPWGTSSWEARAWQTYTPTVDAPVPSCVRVGRLDLADADALPELPALARFAGHGHLFVTAGDSLLPLARALVQSIVLRLIVSTTPGTVRLDLADLVGAGVNLAAFLRLPDGLRGPRVVTRPEDLERLLEALGAHVDEVIQTRLLTLFPSIEEYNARASGVAIPYHVLILTDLPAGLTERSAQRLLWLARNGPRAGVYLVATINEDAPLPRGVDLSELTPLGTTLRLSGPERATWDDPEFRELAIVPDYPPSPAQVDRWLTTVGETVARTPTGVSFERIAIPQEERWTGSAIEGLRVPIGVNGKGEVHHFELGSGVVYHGLVGGIIRSGKSNLLHVLITQLALKYPPEELELYLIDLRVVEFQNYLAARLPHARIVAVEGEPEFAVSVLRRLRAEIERRAALFPPFVSNLTEYRQQTGARLPRILLVIDEFQVLFREEDRLATEAGRLLEDVARRGAAFGLHLLLCSQSPSGGPTFGRRIYDQMGLRIALQCRPIDAQAILGEGNDAASQLERPGEAIYNADRGLKEYNVFVRTALLPPADRQRNLEVIRALAGDRTYPAPISFNGRTPARLEENDELRALMEQLGWPSSSSGATAKLWLGEPIEITAPTAAVLERYQRSNLLLVGGDEDEGYGLLLAALLSLATQRSPANASFVVVDFARPDAAVAGLFRRLQQHLPHSMDLVGPRDAAAKLTELVVTLDRRLGGEMPTTNDIFLCIAGLQRWREARGDPYGPQNPIGQHLTRVADEGPEVGLHLLVWADGFATLERALKRSGVSLFDLRAMLRVGEADSNAFLGSPIAARLEDNRALFRHEDWEMGRTEKFKPYAVPPPEALDALLTAIARKGDD